MIKRIFRVTINSNLREEFERDFQSVSLELVSKASGMISVEIGKPTKWNPDEYLMISNWEDEQALVNFLGENWNESLIPAEMEKYALSHSVVHFYIDKD